MKSSLHGLPEQLKISGVTQQADLCCVKQQKAVIPERNGLFLITGKNRRGKQGSDYMMHCMAGGRMGLFCQVAPAVYRQGREYVFSLNPGGYRICCLQGCLMHYLQIRNGMLSATGIVSWAQRAGKDLIS